VGFRVSGAVPSLAVDPRNPEDDMAQRNHQESALTVATRIAVVGGFDRQARLLGEMAARAGRTVEFHTGDVRGRGAGGLRAVVGRSDLIVIVTDHNSHGAVIAAKRLAREMNRTTMVVTRCGIARFGALLGGLSTRDRPSDATLRR
jgi:hypothetical protein